jgi:hypothetical protein
MDLVLGADCVTHSFRTGLLSDPQGYFRMNGVQKVAMETTPTVSSTREMGNAGALYLVEDTVEVIGAPERRGRRRNGHIILLIDFQALSDLARTLNEQSDDLPGAFLPFSQFIHPQPHLSPVRQGEAVVHCMLRHVLPHMAGRVRTPNPYALIERESPAIRFSGETFQSRAPRG